MGLVDTRTALAQAVNQNLDLVQIGIKDNIPVCQIIDYGKYKYKQDKKLADAKKKQPKHVIKEIRLTPRIEQHDVDIKVRKAKTFLEEGCTVKVSMNFKGRENTHKDIGVKIMDNFKFEEANVSAIKYEGNTIFLILTKAS